MRFIATAIGGISGIGGGVIIKPVMDALLDMPVSTISFMSGYTILAMSIVSMISSGNSDAKIDKYRSTLLAVGGTIGGIAGKTLWGWILSEYGIIVNVVQQILMILLTFGVILYTRNRSCIRLLHVCPVYE